MTYHCPICGTATTLDGKFGNENVYNCNNRLNGIKHYVMFEKILDYSKFQNLTLLRSFELQTTHIKCGDETIDRQGLIIEIKNIMPTLLRWSKVLVMK